MFRWWKVTKATKNEENIYGQAKYKMCFERFFLPRAKIHVLHRTEKGRSLRQTKINRSSTSQCRWVWLLLCALWVFENYKRKENVSIWLSRDSSNSIKKYRREHDLFIWAVHEFRSRIYPRICYRCNNLILPRHLVEKQAIVMTKHLGNVWWIHDTLKEL